MATLVCPVCGKRVDADESPARPFCSQRCRDIDLGRWLEEKYTVPDSPEEPQEPDASQTHGDSSGSDGPNTA
jgi:endogenous inhibitor of DNA gyrase (YacG/DUF329 family)